jgi:hypothetical protein
LGFGHALEIEADVEQISKSKIIFISFATLSKKVPIQADVFVSAIRKDIEALRAEVVSHFPPPQAAATSPTPQSNTPFFPVLTMRQI